MLLRLFYQGLLGIFVAYQKATCRVVLHCAAQKAAGKIFSTNVCGRGAEDDICQELWNLRSMKLKLVLQLRCSWLSRLRLCA